MPATTLVRQSNFTGGEIAPIAWSKTDSPAYQHGLRLALNLIPTQEGPIVNRPGTRYVCPVADSSYAPRLVPFSFADGQNFVIEIGNQYLRFIQAGALVAGVVVTGAAPWLIADVMRLVFTQDGDVITVTHPSYQPYEIARISNLNWTVTAVSFTPQAYFAGRPILTAIQSAPDTALLAAAVGSISSIYSNLTHYDVGEFVLFKGVLDPTHYHLNQAQSATIGVDPDAGSGTVWFDCSYFSSSTFRRGDFAWSPTENKTFVSLLDLNNASTPPSANWAVASDETRPPKDWQWVVTQLWQDANGVVRETAGSTPTPSTLIALYTDRQARLVWSAESGGPASYVVLGYNVYRGRNGIFGFVGSTPAGTRVFNDDGGEPNYAQQPPRGTNPFDIATGAATKTQSWPAAATHHEQRIIYARSNLKPQTFWGSRLGQTKNFDVNTPVQDTDAFDYKPASEHLEEIRSLLSLRYLLLFTGAGVWGAYGGSTAGAINASSINLRRYIKQGASYLKPLAFERSALFQTARGRIMDLQWDWRSDSYIPRDISVIARHLFEGHNVVDWAYAEVPYSLVWAIRDDGVLLSLTYSPGGVEGWARHTTGGVFERVCAIIETDATTGVSEDAVYVVVRRMVNSLAVRYIERFSTRVLPQRQVIAADLTSTFTDDVRLANFLDCALQYDGRAPTSSIVFTGASFSGGDQVTATAAANFIGSPARGFAAGDVGSSLVVDPNGLAGGPFEASIVAVTDATHVAVLLNAALPLAYQNVSVLGVAFASKTLTGLSHLEGRSVTALLDGGVAGPFTVTGGAIELGSAAVIAQVGLSYNSDLDLLDLAAGSVKPNQKSAVQAIFEVVASRGLQAGEDFDSLKTPQVQEVGDGNTVPPLTTGTIEVTLGSSWNGGARACLRQSDPLPLTITAATREVVMGGRS